MIQTPSKSQLARLITLIREVAFPEFTAVESGLNSLIQGQLSSVIGCILPQMAEKLAAAFMEQLEDLKYKLNTDVTAVMENDPAVVDRGEVILCYPLTEVMLHYRTAHALYQLGVPLIPRMLTEIAHSQTGVDIHPAASIGDYFCFDHGTGIVIGATSIIGSHVVLYQGVTLGAKNFKYDEQGHPLNLPRHPILEDCVTVYSGTSILGRVRIGHHTVVGGNVWLSHDVPPYSRILQTKAVELPTFTDGAGI